MTRPPICAAERTVNTRTATNRTATNRTANIEAGGEHREFATRPDVRDLRVAT